MIVRENIHNFQRGKSPKDALDLGLKKKIQAWINLIRRRGGGDDDLGEYIINDDFTITLMGVLDLRGIWYGNLPNYIRFKEIKKGVYKGYHTGLLTHVGGDLTSLRGFPEKIETSLYINENPIDNLIECTKWIGGDFDFRKCEIHSLEGAPDYVGGDVYCGGNPVIFTESDIRKAIKTIKGKIKLR